MRVDDSLELFESDKVLVSLRVAGLDLASIYVVLKGNIRTSYCAAWFPPEGLFSRHLETSPLPEGIFFDVQGQIETSEGLIVRWQKTPET